MSIGSEYFPPSDLNVGLPVRPMSAPNLLDVHSPAHRVFIVEDVEIPQKRNWDVEDLTLFKALSEEYREGLYGFVGQEIDDGLFLGSMSLAHAVINQTARIVYRNGSTVLSCEPNPFGYISKNFAVVSCLEFHDLSEHAQWYGEFPTNPAVPSHFVYVEDDGRDPVGFKNQFKAAFQFIDEQLAEGKKVLIHCKAGMSRSSTLMAAYFMQKYGVLRDEALEHIRSIRPIIYPRISFTAMLSEYEKELKAKDELVSVAPTVVSLRKSHSASCLTPNMKCPFCTDFPTK